MGALKKMVVAVASVSAIAAGVFGLQYAGYMNMQYFMPWAESIRRDVMIESRAYSEATVRELYKLRREYNATQDPVARATIVAAARHQFSIFPEDRLPNDLRAWMQEIR